MIISEDRKRLLILTLQAFAPMCLLCAALVPMERDFTVQRWTTDDGLPGNSVADLGYGPDGLLWGVSGATIWRFDGRRFVRTPAALAEHPYKRKVIRFFAGIPDGRFFIQVEEAGIWLSNGKWEPDLDSDSDAHGVTIMSFATSDGVWSVTGRGLLLRNADRHIFHAAPSEIEENMANKFTWAAPDVSGNNIWISSTRGLYRFSEGRFQHVALPATEDIKDGFERVCAGASGQIWLYGHPDRFYVLREGVWEALPKPVGEWPVRMGVEVMQERNGNELWVGTSDGLFVWNGGEWSRLDPGGLEPSGVIALLLGRDGEMWAGLEGGGLLCIRDRQIRIVRAPDGPAVQTFSAVYEQRDGTLYAGIAGMGLWRGGLERLERMHVPKLHKNTTVLAIAEDGGGGLLIGPSGGSLLHYRAGATEMIYPGAQSPWMDFGIRALLVDPAGDVWAGTQRGLMFKAAEDSGLRWFPDQERGAVNALAQTADGATWLASDRHGVTAVTAGKAHTARRIKSDRLTPFADVRALFVDSRGCLWAGGPEGLAFLGDDGLWNLMDARRIGTVVQILEDAAGMLWIGTLQGIARIARTTAPVQLNWYGRADGLDSEICSGGFGNAGCRLRDGRLLFPTQDGLAVVEPQRLSISSCATEPVLDEVLADGRVLWQNNPFRSRRSRTSSVLSVPAGTRVVTIRYLASNPAEGGRVFFRHRLGDDSVDWSPWTISREALFEKRMPGLYPFSLQVMMRDGRVADLAGAPAIRILPLWWQRRSLQAAGAVLLLLVLGTGLWRLSRRRMRRRLEQLERESALEAERLRIARDIHDRVGAKLTKIGLQNEMLSREPGLPAVCQTLVQEVADTTHETVLSMDEIVWAINPRNDTLENSVNYLIHYTREFLRPAQIAYALDLPVDLPVIPLTGEIRHNLFMAFKEALNNAVKHGHPRHIRLALALTPDRAAMTVEDDGCGFTTERFPDEADGVMNMQQRMESVGGSCRVESVPGKGTRVVLEIPLP